MNRDEQNEQLRERIIDLADLWDGKESGRYGIALQNILDELEIKEHFNYTKMTEELERDGLFTQLHTKCTECEKHDIEYWNPIFIHYNSPEREDERITNVMFCEFHGIQEIEK